jgi:phage tail-like protein
MPESVRRDPFGAYLFTVEIDQENIAYPFRSCSGLRSESQVVELEEGGFNTTTHKLIGRNKYPNLVLKRGLCAANTELYKLRQRFLNDLPDANDPGGELHAGGDATGWRTPSRFSGVVTQLGPEGSYMKWRFSRGWICKWEGPELDASKNEISIESIEIAHEGLILAGQKEPGQK